MPQWGIGNSGNPGRAQTTHPGSLAYSNLYLRVTPTIWAQ